MLQKKSRNIMGFFDAFLWLLSIVPFWYYVNEMIQSYQHGTYAGLSDQMVYGMDAVRSDLDILFTIFLPFFIAWLAVTIIAIWLLVLVLSSYYTSKKLGESKQEDSFNMREDSWFDE